MSVASPTKRSKKAKSRRRKPGTSKLTTDGGAANKADVKTADEKGRVALGKKFANRIVIIEELSDTEVVVKLARVIPEREAWLYENPKALAAVRKGLAQARAGEFVPSPDLKADAAWVAQLEGLKINP